MHDFLDRMDQEREVDVLVLDFMKAFNTRIFRFVSYTLKDLTKMVSILLNKPGLH